IRQSIAEFLQRCGLQYKNVSIDEAWYSECCQEAINRGYLMDLILPHMAAGVAIMSNTYNHLPDHATKMWMCLFTSVLTYIDDMMDRADDLGDVYRFNERFVNCQPQGHPALNALDGLLREAPCYYSSPVSNLIVASSLNFMSSILLDNETKDMLISPQAPSYPWYCRLLSGLADAYGLCIFPSTLPLREYVQCMPDVTIVINHTNDILSYYKEVIKGNTTNYLSLMAASRALTKEDALRELIEKTVQAHHNVLELLRPCAEAYDAYVSFFDGYVKFHATVKRYKLEEIMSERLSS
ncbi:isoprenoid synthase domain-containing protein, partial [Suillus clintonianus]|uniref:isoprenoid synthase domain-containing protein n=1 Tax=Suillus clintonianus TaxID=1904413 RepID=UPI001B86483A